VALQTVEQGEHRKLLLERNQLPQFPLLVVGAAQLQQRVQLAALDQTAT
jgi:hypothetical protein